MLNKEVCKKCINTHQTCDTLPWHAGDEEWWTQGRVSCMLKAYNTGVRILYIQEDPPPGCFYRLEQVVLGSNNSKKK